MRGKIRDILSQSKRMTSDELLKYLTIKEKVILVRQLRKVKR